MQCSMGPTANLPAHDPPRNQRPCGLYYKLGREALKD